MMGLPFTEMGKTVKEEGTFVGTVSSLVLDILSF